MAFRFKALSNESFSNYYGLDDEELKGFGIFSYIADSKPGFPCRVTLTDAEPGERLLLINHAHLPVETPYKSSHAIFVKDGAISVTIEPSRIPKMINNYLLSIRAFDYDNMMMDAVVIDGKLAKNAVEKMFREETIAYLHVHTAKRGCFLAEVVRNA